MTSSCILFAVPNCQEGENQILPRHFTIITEGSADHRLPRVAIFGIDHVRFFVSTLSGILARFAHRAAVEFALASPKSLPSVILSIFSRSLIPLHHSRLSSTAPKLLYLPRPAILSFVSVIAFFPPPRPSRLAAVPYQQIEFAKLISFRP